jgi:hypothetical protein
MYGASPQKREVDDAIGLVQKVRGTIESVLQNQSISHDDARVIYDLTGQIEQKKDELVEQAAQVKALRDRLDRVQREVGISTAELNVTRQVVRKGVKQAIGSQREGASDFLSRTAPGTLDLGRQLARGAATALAGPFAPILGAGYDVAKGAAGVVGGIRKKLSEQQERRFAGRLKAYSPGGLESVSVARGRGTALSGITGIGGREVGRPTLDVGGDRGRSDGSLMDFWNKGAYRAKYTKELLSVLKEGRVRGKGRVSDLGDSMTDAAKDFALLGKAMGPLLLKAGRFALLAVGVGNAVVQFGRLHKAVNDWLGAKDAEREALELSKSSYNNWMKVIEKEGIESVAKQAKMTVRAMAENLAKEEARIDLERRRLRSGVDGILGEMKDVVFGPDVGPSITERRDAIIRVGGADPSLHTIGAELGELNDRLNEQIEQMKRANENMMRRDAEMNEKYPATGNMSSSNLHDSGDALLNEQASGGLGIGD